MDITSGKGGAASSILQGKPVSMNEFASLVNASTPYSFNMVNKPEWFDGTYNWTQIRPMGATYLHPEGVSAAYQNAKANGFFDKQKNASSGGMLGMFEGPQKD